MRFQKGEVVIIVKNINGHEFKIGERVTIKEVNNHNYYATNFSEGWYVEDAEIEREHIETSLTLKELLNIAKNFNPEKNYLVQYNASTLKGIESGIVPYGKEHEVLNSCINYYKRHGGLTWKNKITGFITCVVDIEMHLK